MREFEREELEQGMRLLLRLPRNRRVQMVFDYAYITASEVARAMGCTTTHVASVFRAEGKSRPVQAKAIELLRRKLHERGLDWCPTEDEVFRPDCDLSTEECVNA